jgi:hypothetical protein
MINFQDHIDKFFSKAGHIWFVLPLIILSLFTFVYAYLDKMIAVVLASTLMYAIGFIMAADHLDTFVKTFTFTLPNYQRLQRHVLFSVCWFFAGLWSLIFLACNHSPEYNRFILGILLFFLYAFVYWAAVWITFSVRQTANSIFGLFILFALLPLISLENKESAAHYFSFIYQFYWLIIACSICIHIYWFCQLCSRDSARKFSGRRILGFYSNSAEKEQSILYSLQKETIGQFLWSNFCEHYFRKQMAIHQTHSLKVCMWGQLYHIFSRWASTLTTGSLLGWAFVPVFFSIFTFISSGGEIIVGIYLTNLFRPKTDVLYSSMLICSGRKERFLSLLTSTMLQAFCLTITYMVIAAISIYIAQYLSPLYTYRHSQVFHGFDFCMFHIPLTFFFCRTAASLLFPQSRLMQVLCGIIPALLCYMPFFFTIQTAWFRFIIGPVFMIISGWIMIHILAKISFYQDLIILREDQ